MRFPFWRGRRRKADGRRVLTAPYEERDGWAMNVMQCDGTLYLEEHFSDAKLAEKYVLIFRAWVEGFYRRV